MLNNFIYAKKKSLFLSQLEAGNVLDEAIVFIEDTREIWNHGIYFDGNAVDLSNIEKSIQDILDNIPTKVSDLENDKGYLTEHQDISHLATKAELPTVPTKVSELENDSKFITIDEVPEVTVPTKTSDLTNDSGFITLADVPVQEIPEEYITETELSQKGFLVGEETSEELDDVETNTYVKYVAQTLTEEQKAQVRNNIDAIGNNSNTFVSYTQQTLTEEQQKQARLNIGLNEISSINYDLNVKAINHRGYSYESPENTIPAYIMSKDKGFTYVEGDVAFTKDNVAVLLHDNTIDRTSNGSGKITDFNYQELLQYDFGSWFSSEYEGVRIPTFKEWILLCKNLGLHPYIELKSSGSYTQAQITQVVNEVAACGMKGKVTYISFNNTFLGYVKNADVSARLGFLTSTLASGNITTAKNLKTTSNEVFLDAKLATLKDSVVDSCISNNIPLEVWTVNTEDEIINMHSYISGVTSDYLVAGRTLYNNALVYVPPVSTWVPTTGISLDKTSLTFSSFDTITLVATVEPSNSSEEIVWKSSNTSVATVVNGVVTPIADGSCVITVTSGDFSDSCSVNIAFTRYNITRNLTGCSLSNTEDSVLISKTYSGEIIPNEGYSLKNGTVKITMGGVDITSSAYSNGIINIENVTGDIVITVVGVVVPVYSITRNLVGCASDKNITTIGEGNPYNETFTALENYRLSGATITITMGDTDISSMYSDGVLSIPKVTGNIVININAVVIPVYSITRSLINCISDKDVTSIKDGESYTETLTANDGYTLRDANVIITMGGVDITTTSYFNGVLNIDSVDGDIAISVEAVEIVGVQPIIDLYLTNVKDGKIMNLGTGGSTYDATISIPSSSRDSYTVSENGLILNNHAYANTPYGFKASDQFTIIIKARITQKSSNTYQRVFRTDQDTPSLFYSINSTTIGGKLAGKSGNGFTVHNDLGSVTGTGGALNTCYLSIYNEDGFDESIMHEYMYTSNGTTMKFYVDGVLIASQNASVLVTSTKIGLGDNNTSQNYYATQIEVSEFKIYNQELTL